MTQIVLIIAYMLNHGGITNRQAMQIGVGRLSARIGELRAMGIGIDTVWVVMPKRNGRMSRFGRYVFHSEESGRLAYERFVRVA